MLVGGNKTQPFWKATWQFLKKLSIHLPYDPAIPPLGISLLRRKGNICPCKDLDKNTHGSFICDSQNPKITEIPAHGRMDEPSTVHPFDELLLDNERA